MTLKEYFQKGITYDEYMTAFEKAVADKRTSGHIQTEELVHYTELNLTRSKRIYKHTELNADMIQAAQAVGRPIEIICITEFWCGDAAQINPVIKLIANKSDKIKIKYLFRDENVELMDLYLTNNGRAIPIYILLDAETGVELDHWGPRAADAQALVMKLKLSNTPYEELKEIVQRWYIADKTFSIQKEWTLLLTKYNA